MRFEDHEMLGSESGEDDVASTLDDMVKLHARFIYEPCTHDVKVLGEVTHTIECIDFQIATCQACGLNDIVLRIQPNSEVFYNFLKMQFPKVKNK